MTKQTTHPKSQPPNHEIESCDAVMIALDSKRFVIVRKGGRMRIRSAEQFCRSIRNLRPGESVYYGGRRDTVRALAVY